MSAIWRIGGAVVWLAVASPFSEAQTLQQRIEGVRQAQVRQGVDAQMERLNIQARLRDLVDPVDIVDVRLRNVLQWYSATTGIPIVIDWRAMEQAGIDPDRPITIQMRHVPAGQLLGLILKMAAPDELAEAGLMYEASPWYVQVMTRRQADSDLIVRVYDVGDLLMEAPHFTNAPQFDLNEALSNTSSGGSNRGGATGRSGSGLFRDDDANRGEARTRHQRGEELVQLIRDTVEPTVWADRGGVATIRYHAGRLIVSAPRYVHAQIGMPVIALDRDPAAVAGSTWAAPTVAHGAAGHRTLGGKVSAVQQTTTDISSVGE